CAPMGALRLGAWADGFVDALARSRDEGALHSDVELLSWFTAERTRHDVRSERVPLAGLPDWVHDGSVIEHAEGRYFRVVGVAVGASNREVRSWAQPLIEPRGVG